MIPTNSKRLSVENVSEMLSSKTDMDIVLYYRHYGYDLNCITRMINRCKIKLGKIVPRESSS